MSDAASGGEGLDREQRLALAGLRRATRRMAWVYSAAAICLLPWIAYLAVSLPKRDFDRHYRAAWVGFDLLLVFAIVRTAYMAFRLDPRVQVPATATATLLFVDAWFDVMTAGSHKAVAEALLLALVFEIPAAIFTLVLARRVSSLVLEIAHFDRLVASDPDPPHSHPHLFRHQGHPTPDPDG